MNEQNNTKAPVRAPTTGSIKIKSKYRFQRWKGTIIATVLAASITAGAIAGLRNCGEEPRPQPQILQKCCPDGWKTLRRKTRKGFAIDCIEPKAEPICPNGKCEKPTENAKNCPQDCDPVCGDGFITHKEKCDTKAKPTGCGKDQICTDGCSRCMDKPANCGDGKLARGEQCETTWPLSKVKERCTSLLGALERGWKYVCKLCRCEKEELPPSCGDGRISRPAEQCDPRSEQNNRGCNEDQTCNAQTCMCEDKPPPPPPKCGNPKYLGVNPPYYKPVQFTVFGALRAYKQDFGKGDKIRIRICRQVDQNDNVTYAPELVKDESKVPAGIQNQVFNRVIRALSGVTKFGETTPQSAEFDVVPNF